MAFKIKNIDGVICLKGEVATTHIREVYGFIKASFRINDQLIVNLCELTSNHELVKNMLEGLKTTLNEDQQLIYYGFTEPKVKQLFAEINNPANFYQAA